MTTIEEIRDTILLAKSYQAELTEELLEDQKSGCMDCRDQSIINQIENLVLSLNNRANRNDLGSSTDKIYGCLLKTIANYSGSSIPLDPNADVPNTIIVIDGGSGDGKPYGINIFYEDMTGDNGSGGRTTYTNPLWIGWYPQMQTTGVVELFQYKDYDYDVATGTFTLRADAESGVTGIYEGGSIRVTDYNKTGDTPPPVDVFTYKLVNNSSIDTEYTLQSVTSSLTVGQTVENGVVVGQSVAAVIQTGQQLVYTIYNADGSVYFTDTRTTAGTLNGIAMTADRSQEFIYTDLGSTSTIVIDNTTDNDITVYLPNGDTQIIPSGDSATIVTDDGDIIEIGSDEPFKIGGTTYTPPNKYQIVSSGDQEITVTNPTIPPTEQFTYTFPFTLS